MNEPNALLDTNTLILLEAVAAELPRRPVVSTITLAELSVGPLVATSGAERAERQRHLQLAEADFDPIAFDRSAARAFGQVAADLRAAGRKPRARAFDALIAAVAIANDLPLHTVNPRDFDHISGLTVVSVAHPDQPPG